MGIARERAYLLACRALESGLIPKPRAAVKADGSTRAGRNCACRTLRGVLFDEDMRTLIRFPPDMEDETYFVPDSVETISDRAFEKSNIRRVVLPKRLRRIGDYAFYYSKVESADLPESLEHMGERAFSCSNIKEVRIPPKVTSIPEGAFDNSGLRSVIFSGPVERIGAIAFCHCDLEDVAIPDTVKIIEPLAFCECFRLRSIALPPLLRIVSHRAF